MEQYYKLFPDSLINPFLSSNTFFIDWDIANGGFIVLTSDNPDKSNFQNFNLKEDEIVSIWYVEWYLSAKLPNILISFYSRLERLENSIEDLNRKFEDLEKIELKPKPK